MARTVAAVELTDGTTRWQLAQPALPVSLMPYVRSWMGYTERAPGPTRRRELPAPQYVVIFELGPSLRVSASGSEVCASTYRGGFVAGIDDSFSMTEHDGHHAGIQVNLTPLGARSVLDVSLADVTRRVVALADVAPGARTVSDQLADAPTWAERFGVVERWLVDRIRAAPAPSAQVSWATRQLERTGGLVRVAGLCSELGCGRKHLAALFQEHVGVTPKVYATLIRFDRLVGRIRSSPGASWADLALDLGFADQAHLAREVRRFAGVTPTDLRRLVHGAPIGPGDG